MKFLVVAVLALWTVAIVRLVALTRTPTQRHLSIGLVAFAVACTLELDPVAQRLTGIPGASPNVAHLAKHMAAVVAALAVSAVVQALASRDTGHQARRIVALSSASGALIVLFAIAPVHDEPRDGLTAAAAGEPTLLAYWAVYTAVIGAVCLGIARVAFNSVRMFHASSLRTGMRWMGAGAVIALTYCAHKAFFLVVASLDPGRYDVAVMERVQSTLLALTMFAFVVGLTIPTITQWPLIRHVNAYLNYRRLYPLWQAYLQSEPGIALGETGRSVDVEMRLYRRMVEIRDGMIAVRPFGDARVRDVALHEAQQGLHEDSDLLAEAAWLEVARRAKLRGDTPASESSVVLTGGDTMTEELRILVRIARQWSTIQSIADRIEHAITARNSE
jgi:hypothetical protein